MSTVAKSKIVKQTNVRQTSSARVVFKDAGIYINPLTDFGFKRIFGTEANKDLLIDFLNAVLNIDGGIKDLQYTNPERKGRIKTDRTVIFDLHCITGKGERFIIEMQKLSQDYYKDRALYYVSYPIQEQSERKRKWDFMLHPVYSVNIVNFKLDKTRKAAKYASYVQLMNRDTHEVFYDKLMFVYLELPRFRKKVDELQTNVERWMYVLKHLSRLNDLPDALRNRIFKKLFEQAKIAKMSPEERNSYDQSLNDYRVMYLKEDEYKRNLAARDRIIASERKALQKVLAESVAKDARIAELERRLGLT